MEIIEYFKTTEQAYWLAQVKRSDWRAGQYLHRVLSEGKLQELYGETTLVYLLTQERELVAFCILAEQDNVHAPDYTPWIGFVYTFPAFRGHRHMGQLLKKAEQTAWERGAEAVYLSTEEIGLYERYGYSFYRTMRDRDGEETCVYRKVLETIARK